MNDDTSKTPEQEQAQREEEISAYDKLVEQIRSHMERLKTTVDAEAFKNTIDKAANELREVGDHSLGAITKASEALKKDLATSVEHAKPALESLQKGAEQTFGTMQNTSTQLWKQFAEGTSGAFFAWRDWTGSATAEFLKNVSTWSANIGDRLDQALEYHAGEITHSGVFKCQNCKAEVTLKKTGHLPPCPECQQTRFKRA